MTDENLPNKSKHLYFKIAKLLYYFGAPNYWYEDLDIPRFVQIIHDFLVRLTDILIWAFCPALFGSLFTQNNLNEKQKADRAIFAWCLPVYYLVLPAVARQKEKVRDVAYNLIKMKEIHNDLEVEKDMIKQAKVCYTLLAFFMFSMLVLYGVNGVIHVVLNGANFVTVITAWPDVQDTSLAAGAVRVFAYSMWWIYLTRVMFTSYIAVVAITISLSHQYKNLSSYFYSLVLIFEDETKNQEEKEMKYEEAFKVGIQMHANTLRCSKLTQEICSIVFSVQIIVNVASLIMIMLQMMNSERTPGNAMSTATTGITVLISTGLLWWNAGDITVEASFLSTAMFNSGWHHCRKESSLRMRPLVTIAMWQSQVPMELRCLGVVKLSYQSYVTIVRSSYSIFSVIY